MQRRKELLITGRLLSSPCRMPVHLIRSSSRLARFGWVVLAISVGAGVGYLAYEIGAQKGWRFFVSSGAFLGGFLMLAILAFTPYVAALTIREVEVTLPTLGKLKFAPMEGEREAAWKLFIEAVTRISAQPLEPGTGILREALNSLYSLFSNTREILKGLDPKTIHRSTDQITVDVAATSLLNHQLRPFLAKWHPLLLEFENQNAAKPEGERLTEASWDRNSEFRLELETLRKDLVQYIWALGKLAEVPRLQDILPPEP